MAQEDKIKEFLSNDKVRAVLFDEVPPVITLNVRYLEHVENELFELNTSRIQFTRCEWKTDAGEIAYGYMKNPENLEDKIITFLSQFQNIEVIWLEQKIYGETRYIGLK